MLGTLVSLYRDAGGAKFVFATPYLYFAALLTFLFLDRDFEEGWMELAQAMFPSLIGFSLATFAIVLALFGAENLSKLAKKKENAETSPLSKLTALVVHTSLVQLFALILSFALVQESICVGTVDECGWAHMVFDACLWVKKLHFWEISYSIGFFFTVYGLTLIASTLLAVFQTSQLTK